MKKNLMILTLVLALVLPVIGLAAETVTATEKETTPNATIPYGMQAGRRWNQTPVPTAPSLPNGKGFDRWDRMPVTPYRFVDENNDGICDICESEQGKNVKAPGYVDADGNGVCDNLGTKQQHQGQAQMRSMRASRRTNGPDRGFAGADDNSNQSIGRVRHHR